ncbi:MAG: NADH-quinone oxidoreductase subunit M [Candidatus Nezhaarchaeota archaeon]|nr:NADH-quinone oxidoreductase subunit M [Candidatus Nezhaarchaeota archaeon]MCX8142236.1 NADH-quinone oxidoreductase subunit M [Candidatus Nezhaarchaeota archaeon]MDW8050791.1 NADH-quinone oxidoreductase subunit M [Nitrososphaerota archaeon]
MIEDLLVYTVLVPAITAFITFGLNKPLGRWNGIIAFLASLLSVCILSAAACQIFSDLMARGILRYYERVYDWVVTDSLTLRFGFKADGLSTPVALTVAIVSALIALYAVKEMRNSENMGIFFSLYQLLFLGMVGLTLSTNLIEFFIFFEICVVASWALVNGWGSGDREKVALKFFLFTEAGALCFLAGIVATNGYLGTLEIGEIQLKIMQLRLETSILIAIVFAMLVGLFVKMAIFPLHSWLPDTYVEAPTPITALFSSALSGLAAYAIARIVFLYTPALQYVAVAMIVLAVITMIYGAVNALGQDDFKRLLAYSSISQMGYILLGLGAAAFAVSMGASSLAAIAATGSMFHYIAHAMGKAVLFLLVGVFTLQVGTSSISKMGGLAGKMPLTSVLMFIGFFTLMGVPFTSGFIGEWMIFTGAVSSASLVNDAFALLIALIAIIATVLTFAYALWSIRKMLFGQTPQQLNDVREAQLSLLTPLIVMALISLFLGIYPTIFSEEIRATILPTILVAP